MSLKNTRSKTKSNRTPPAFEPCVPCRARIGPIGSLWACDSPISPTSPTYMPPYRDTESPRQNGPRSPDGYFFPPKDIYIVGEVGETHFYFGLSSRLRGLWPLWYTSCGTLALSYLSCLICTALSVTSFSDVWPCSHNCYNKVTVNDPS